MKFFYKLLYSYLIPFLLLLIFITGCSSNNNGFTKLNTNNNNNNNKIIPEGLLEFESEITSILETLDKDLNNGQENDDNDNEQVSQSSDGDKSNKSKDDANKRNSNELKHCPESDDSNTTTNQDSKSDENSSEDGSKGEGSNNQNDSSDSETFENDDDKGEDSNSDTGQDSMKESFIERRWKSVTSKTRNMHKQWNDLQLELVKNGVNQELILDFSKSLNNLTICTDKQNVHDCLFSANNLCRLIPDFLDQYDCKVPPNLKRIGCFIRDTKYNAMINNWEESNLCIGDIKKYWSLVRSEVGDEQKKYTNNMESSINELDKVMQEFNIKLTTIKSDIALDNLKELERSFQKANNRKSK